MYHFRHTYRLKNIQKISGKYAMSSYNKKDMKKKRIVLCVIGVVVLSVLLGGVMVYRHYYGLLGKDVGKGSGTVVVEEEPVASESPEEMKQRLEEEVERNLEAMQGQATLDEHLINILCIGVDSRNDDLEGRSDAMILFTINTDEKKMVMTSLMRDCYVSIPGYGNNRLNAAYAFGGAELLYQTIQANFGIEVDKCIVVNFQFVAKMVDALNGVDLTLSKDEVEVMNDYVRSMNGTIFDAEKEDGVVPVPETDTVDLHLSGKQALGYSRNRYTGTDYNRTERQRNVITKCLEKLKRCSLFELHALAEELLPDIGTDLSEGDIAKLLLIMADMNSYELQQFTMPSPGTSYDLVVNGMMVLGVDYAANLSLWNTMVYGE